MKIKIALKIISDFDFESTVDFFIRNSDQIQKKSEQWGNYGVRLCLHKVLAELVHGSFIKDITEKSIGRGNFSMITLNYWLIFRFIVQGGFQ